uniref:Uncharacterized protein n=1 Tax=Vespula pensylvanica TaxID=30213 RepID=A0A834UCU1_VESPE|nr:hypothetical protein H0235_004749 [Vespula pensylvanica]
MNRECPSILCILVLLMVLLQRASAIDCFKCVSIDGDNKPCDDPFHNNGSLAFLESPCLGGRKGRDGLFPATACIKISGIYDESGISLTVRSCALDSGTLTTDSEIIRMSHCGGFYFDDKDLCIDAMRTYLNAFHGIVNIVKSIKCDDVEDFASACIVVILWVEAIRIVMSLVKQKGSRTGNIGVSMGSHEIVKNSLRRDIEGYDTKTSSYKVLEIKFTLQFQCHDSSESTDTNMDLVWSKSEQTK